MIAAHRLPRDAFLALASGAGDPGVVRHLREAQQSKHLMLLHAVAEAAGEAGGTEAAVAFRVGRRLLGQVQSADPGAVARLLSLPHIGGWAHDCLISLDRGEPPDFGYLAGAAAAAALRAGVRFELDVPVRDGRVFLPGLGCLHVTARQPWIRLSSDGMRLTVGDHADLPCAALLPDDGSAETVPHWQGTPQVRAVADGQVWEVLLETADPHLDRYLLPMLTAMTADEARTWRHRIQSAWQVLVRHHQRAAGPIAAGVPVIVPLVPRSSLDSATSRAAFGAIATSLPPGPVTMAETLVHEFQHIKLCGLTDMLPLVERSEEMVYAPWRDDPRPASGLLQGVYAHLGITHFWNTQRQVEPEPDDVFRAQVTYERWRPAIELATATLLRTGSLTPTGVWFVSVLREEGQSLRSESVSAQAQDVAREVGLDHWLSWQFRHTAIDAAGLASLVAAYRSGEPFTDQTLPETWIEDDVRKTDSTARSRMLAMSYLEPATYRRMCAAGMPELSEADRFLAAGNADAAVQAYRDGIAAFAGPHPSAWIGLALAIHRLPETPLRQVFATKLPLLFEMHACLDSQGVHTDALRLAAWFA